LLRSAAVARLLVGSAAAVGVWIGCSSDPAPATTTVVADAGSGPVRIPPQPDPGFDAGPSCWDDCTSRHPVGAPLNAAIDRCWTTSCTHACFELAAGGIRVPEAPDAGDAGDDAGDAGPPACGAVPVATPTDACNTCTVASCCDSWAACFSNQDCTDLNACLQLCPISVTP